MPSQSVRDLAGRKKSQRDLDGFEVDGDVMAEWPDDGRFYFAVVVDRNGK